MASTSVIIEMNNKMVKLEVFNRTNFKRWKTKIHFHLTTLKIVYVLTTPKPPPPKNEEAGLLEVTKR